MVLLKRYRANFRRADSGIPNMLQWWIGGGGGGGGGVLARSLLNLLLYLKKFNLIRCIWITLECKQLSHL